MPLIEGKSDKARSENIAKEIGAGKKPAQAEAIAYSVQRKAKQAADINIGGENVTVGKVAHAALAASHAVDTAGADSKAAFDGLRGIAADCMAYDRKRK